MLTFAIQKFSDIVGMRYPYAIRISCHAHGNAGPKYAFDMLPGAARAASPVRILLHALHRSLVNMNFLKVAQRDL